MNKLNMEQILKNHKTKIISTEEALSEVEPYLTQEEMEDFISKITDTTFTSSTEVSNSLNKIFKRVKNI